MRPMKSLIGLAALACGIMFISEGGLAMADTEAKILTPDDIVMLPQSAIDSNDPEEIVEANSDVMRQLFFGYVETHGYIKIHEVSRAARASFDVHYYLSEVNNGGFAQYVHNTR